MTFTDHALIVRRERWRERDKKITFFTEQHGLVQGVAIGAQKITSKLSAHVEPLRHVEVMLAAGKNGFTVAQVETQKNFIFDGAPDAVFLSALYARLAQKLTEPCAADPILFGLLLRASESAHAGVGDAGEFLYMIAQHVGMAPEFGACVLCSSDANLKWFSSELGGVVCGACQKPTGALPFLPQEKNNLFVLMKAFFEWRGLC